MATYDTQKYLILDYSTGRIIEGLGHIEVCVTARVLKQISGPAGFDIVEIGTYDKVFVTSQFRPDDNGRWHYYPSEQAALCQATD